MNEKKRRLTVGIVLYNISRFILFLVSSSFLVTCCVLMMFDSMQFDPRLLRKNAPLTLYIVLLFSLFCWGCDALRRYFQVDRHVRRIIHGLERIQSGDLSMRIAPICSDFPYNKLDSIIAGINQMAQELSNVEMLRTDFISNVSHELKTPLTVIDNYATLLQNPKLTQEERAEYAKAISSGTQRLSSLITNILKLNKLENQQIYPPVAPYDLGEQLCECMLGFETVWEEKNLQIETDIEDGVIIRADRELLSLVWSNLLSNAVKFTEPGGAVSCRLRTEGNDAVVTVSDTGCGMSPEVGEHIFEKFYQGDTSHAVQGNGLGLTLVKKVIDIVGGDICVRSAPGAGSTFTVRLRRQQP